MSSVFSIVDSAAGEVPDVLGIWAHAPTELLFAGSSGQPIWHCALPADALGAEPLLVGAEQALAASRDALDLVPGRLVELAGSPLEKQTPITESSFARRLASALNPSACVETEIGGRLVARTMLDWRGDVHSVILNGADRGQMSAHARVVRLAVESRTTVLKSLGVAVRGVALLRAALANPPGAVLLLPAAWRLVESVQAEARARRSLT